MYCWFLTENDNKMWWECCDRDVLSQVPEHSTMSARLESVFHKQSTSCHSASGRIVVTSSVSFLSYCQPHQGHDRDR